MARLYTILGVSFAVAEGSFAGREFLMMGYAHPTYQVY